MSVAGVLPVWSRYILAGLLAIGAYHLVGLGSSPASRVAGVVLYSAISLSAAVALYAGPARHRPSSRTPWHWLAGSQVLYFVADTTFNVRHQLLGLTSFPSIADPLYFLHYLPLLVALVLFIRRRSPGRDRASMLDAATLAVAVALISWVFLLDPNLAAPDLDLGLRLAAMFQPLMDIAVLTLGLRLVIGSGVRTASFYLLTAGMAVNLVTNSVLGMLVLTGTYRSGNLLDATWLLAYLLLGACALHPSMARLTEPSSTEPTSLAENGVAWGRLALLAVASLTAPAMLVIQQQVSGHVSLRVNAAASAVLCLLVIARLGELVRVSRLVSVTDGLTGLYNRRFFEEQLLVQTRRAPLGARPIGMLIIDVDRFKLVNDTYGHPAGDRVLQQVAERLRSHVRGSDVVARYGGEEFAVLVRDVNEKQLLGLAERLRQAVSGAPMDLADGQLVAITVSVGVASRVADPVLLPVVRPVVVRIQAVVTSADLALYEAKAGGRNQCVLAPPAEELTVRSTAG